MAPLSALRRTMHDSLTLNSPSRSPSVRKGLAHGGGAAGSRRTSSSIETMRPLIFKKQQSLPTILPSSSKLLNLIVYQDDLGTCVHPPFPRIHKCNPIDANHRERKYLSICPTTLAQPPIPSPRHAPTPANISYMYPSAGISQAHLAALFSCPPLEPANTLTNPVVRRSAKSTTQLRNEYVHAIPATSRATLHRSDTFPLGHAAQCTGGGSRRSLPAYMPMTAQERSEGLHG
ncbi:hypothetical protein BCR44DRAFT_1174695 [Catenaria anguillulae PL171]|uniref:Uncharacterized protein n=1 Tax=Catenaria anguillulae PL171 TaxID=765915 RepID=A0A1Y2I4P7_9FUNG|nr:hypothetical protein BCR44DRAFT_1174695 [Catenaria anguillulae PL171]